MRIIYFEDDKPLKNIICMFLGRIVIKQSHHSHIFDIMRASNTHTFKNFWKTHLCLLDWVCCLLIHVKVLLYWMRYHFISIVVNTHTHTLTWHTQIKRIRLYVDSCGVSCHFPCLTFDKTSNDHNDVPFVVFWYKHMYEKCFICFFCII